MKSVIYVDDDGQWKDSNKKVSTGSNVLDTSSSQDIDVLEPILSSPQHKPPTFTFAEDFAFTKGSMDDKLFYEVPKLDTRGFDNYNGFSTLPAVGHFGPNYVYAVSRQMIASI